MEKIHAFQVAPRIWMDLHYGLREARIGLDISETPGRLDVRGRVPPDSLAIGSCIGAQLPHNWTSASAEAAPAGPPKMARIPRASLAVLKLRELDCSHPRLIYTRIPSTALPKTYLYLKL